MQLLISLAGILVLVLCACAISENRKAINWRTVGGHCFYKQVSPRWYYIYPWGR